MKHLSKKINQGFTLIELMIAVAILALVIGAVTLLESRNVSYTTTTKLQTQGNGVASEGLNLVRSIINGNNLGNTGGVCSNPADTTKCDPGVYYIHQSSGKLNKCNDCKDEAGNTQPCPTVADEVNTTQVWCADSGARRSVNNKDFYQTIIISAMCPL